MGKCVRVHRELYHNIRYENDFWKPCTFQRECAINWQASVYVFVCASVCVGVKVLCQQFPKSRPCSISMVMLMLLHIWIFRFRISKCYCSILVGVCLCFGIFDASSVLQHASWILLQQTVIYNYPCIRSALKVCTIFRAKAFHAIRLACLHVKIKTKTFHVPNTHASWIIDSFAARDSFIVHFIAFSPLSHWYSLMVRIQVSSKRHVIPPHIESLGSRTLNESSMQDFLNDS